MVVLVFRIDETPGIKDFTNDIAELDYYFDEIGTKTGDRRVQQRTIVLIDERENSGNLTPTMKARYDTIHTWCDQKGLQCMDVSAATGCGIGETYEMIADCLINQVSPAPAPAPNRQGRCY
jgi:hypothetical protein